MKRAALLLIAPVLFAQPHLQNAKLESRAVAGSLESTVQNIRDAGAPAWIGYSVPQISGDRNMCCWNDDRRGCALEPGNPVIQPAGGPVKLEGSTEFYVFYRVENKQVEKIRSFSPDCEIDAGGLPFYWLTGVNAAQSVELLESLIPKSDARDTRRLRNAAMSAIALHRDPAADSALDRFANPPSPEDGRKEAALWLGSARGAHGYETLVKMLTGDPDDSVREQAVFGLSRSREAGAIPAIVRAAHDDKSVRVRERALYWLARSAESRIATTAIKSAIDQDPSEQLRKHAVSALAQIPNGEGVPLLIEVARTHRDPQIQKEAMAWLGRSQDPRALKFFEQVLTR